MRKSVLLFLAVVTAQNPEKVVEPDAKKVELKDKEADKVEGKPETDEKKEPEIKAKNVTEKKKQEPKVDKKIEKKKVEGKTELKAEKPKPP
jgi:hypothetical protein